MLDGYKVTLTFIEEGEALQRTQCFDEELHEALSATIRSFERCIAGNNSELLARAIVAMCEAGELTGSDMLQDQVNAFTTAAAEYIEAIDKYRSGLIQKEPHK